jgi:hypothetical protein
MRTASTSIVAVMLLAVAPAARAGDDPTAGPGAQASAGKHCFGDARPKWLASTTLAGQVNPLGLELQLQLGRCLPLITTPGDLFDYTNVQYGLAAYLSPVYAMPGAFVSIAPLSVLELRAEAEYVQQWPIGLDASGYFPLTGYDAPLKSLPAADARPARGYTANFTANLQAELPLAERWSLLAVNSASYQLWRLGDAAYYYNVRYDLTMARRDWILRDTALVLVNHDLSDRLKLRFGVTDDLSWVKGSGYHQNLLGALVTGVISRWPGPRSETQPFLRLAVYTRHAHRQDELQLLAGVGVTFDVSPRVPAR